MRTSPDNSEQAGPVAFMCYSHADDGSGRVAAFREHLVEELRVQMGTRDAEIFIDNDIEVGAPWRKRIAEALGTSTFLLPIVTPNFLASEYCREELHAFLAEEERLGRDDLILPVYYVECEDFLAGIADEPAAATWEAIGSRQLFPWWHLRHKDPMAEDVCVERTRLAKQIQKALARPRPAAGGASPTTPPEAGAADASPPPFAPAQPTPTRAPPLDELFSSDPVRSRPAAAELLARGGEDVARIVARLHDMSEPTLFVVREVLARHPRVSGPPMLARIEAAEDNWMLATQVPRCLGPAHAPSCEGPLLEIVTGSSQVDVVRKAIEGLGYMGTDDGVQEVLSLLASTAESGDPYLYDKYYGYCVEAAARAFRSTPMEAAFRMHLDTRAGQLERAVKLVGSRGWQSIVYPNMRHILSRCKPHHADAFVSDWLTSDNEDLRDLGAYALGGIGVRWAVPALLGRCFDRSEAIEVRRTAAFAAGVLGGAEALEGLRGLDSPEDEELLPARDNALAICVGAADGAEFRRLAEDLIARDPSELCWVYRRIGLRGDDGLLDLVREGMEAEETAVRGDAALALARLAGPEQAAALNRAHAQASSVRESLLTSLALLAAGEEIPGDPRLEKLRELLMAESLLYRSPTQRDVVAVLRAGEHPEAAAVAAAWEPLYEASSSY